MNGLTIAMTCGFYLAFCAVGIRQRVRLYDRGLSAVERLLSGNGRAVGAQPSEQGFAPQSGTDEGRTSS